MVNRAHFPDIYSKSMPSQRSANSSDSSESNGENEESKEIVDWKYDHPRNLRAAEDNGKSGGDVIDEDDFYLGEDDDPF